MSEKERLAKLIEEASEVTSRLSKSAVGNQSTITINAGGWGIFACAVMCAFVCGLSVSLLISHSRQEARINDMEKYVHVIYQQIPSLRIKGEKNDDHPQPATAPAAAD